ncbi:uncharacterized protein N7487_006246 [Penicillium crustosum]|uniref:uncharacterized protein n=1 Tax=Penicillium crustosum TaxID=36656 RepID=UPI00238A48DD|nr:uncharacterized protein N7487_006246 [Penicillium crustosum]KAJ5411887.1 hypothetical protein N7487_006246 [Penicillium crustosum]
MPILSLEHSPNNLLRNSLGVKQGIRPSILKSQIPNKVGPSEIPCNKHKPPLGSIRCRVIDHIEPDSISSQRSNSDNHTMIFLDYTGQELLWKLSGTAY